MKKSLLIIISCLFFISITYTYSYNSSKSNHQLFENKHILILGGTGFLGRAITTELLKYNPKKIIIFSRDEVKHFNFKKIFGNNHRITHVIGDIKDYQRLNNAMRGTDIVFHAAALKRIDILETNVEECIKTNVVGSLNVFNACIANDVKKVIFISTDKACFPINAYGACKFVSEKLFGNYDKKNIKTQFIIARYGNVLESTGSVIPIFTEKIQNGEDIPLTDDRMTRFIIEKKEAVELIFDALRYGIGGEIFVRKLPAFKITDLIQVIKDKYNATNKIKVIGIRPGEKLHESMVSESEMIRTICFKNYFVIRPTVDDFDYDEQVTPIYEELGQPFDFDNGEWKHYSSDQEVISKDELNKLFSKLGIL